MSAGDADRNDLALCACDHLDLASLHQAFDISVFAAGERRTLRQEVLHRIRDAFSVDPQHDPE
jgi:hypothetical protein